MAILGQPPRWVGTYGGAHADGSTVQNQIKKFGDEVMVDLA